MPNIVIPENPLCKMHMRFINKELFGGNRDKQLFEFGDIIRILALAIQNNKTNLNDIVKSVFKEQPVAIRLFRSKKIRLGDYFAFRECLADGTDHSIKTWYEEYITWEKNLNNYIINNQSVFYSEQDDSSGKVIHIDPKRHEKVHDSITNSDFAKIHGETSIFTPCNNPLCNMHMRFIGTEILGGDRDKQLIEFGNIIRRLASAIEHNESSLNQVIQKVFTEHPDESHLFLKPGEYFNFRQRLANEVNDKHIQEWYTEYKQWEKELDDTLQSGKSVHTDKNQHIDHKRHTLVHQSITDANFSESYSQNKSWYSIHR